MFLNYHLHYIIFMSLKMIPTFETFLQLLSEYWVTAFFSNSSAGGVGAGGLANSEAANRNLWGVAWCF